MAYRCINPPTMSAEGEPTWRRTAPPEPHTITSRWGTLQELIRPVDQHRPMTASSRRAEDTKRCRLSQSAQEAPPRPAVLEIRPDHATVLFGFLRQPARRRVVQRIHSAIASRDTTRRRRAAAEARYTVKLERLTARAPPRRAGNDGASSKTGPHEGTAFGARGRTPSVPATSARLVASPHGSTASDRPRGDHYHRVSGGQRNSQHAALRATRHDGALTVAAAAAGLTPMPRGRRPRGPIPVRPTQRTSPRNLAGLAVAERVLRRRSMPRSSSTTARHHGRVDRAALAAVAATRPTRVPESAHARAPRRDGHSRTYLLDQYRWGGASQRVPFVNLALHSWQRQSLACMRPARAPVSGRCAPWHGRGTARPGGALPPSTERCLRDAADGAPGVALY